MHKSDKDNGARFSAGHCRNIRLAALSPKTPVVAMLRFGQKGTMSLCTLTLLLESVGLVRQFVV
jgi:hypothetical protein